MSTIHTPHVIVDTARLAIVDPAYFGDDRFVAELIRRGCAVVLDVNHDGTYPVVLTPHGARIQGDAFAYLSADELEPVDPW